MSRTFKDTPYWVRAARNPGRVHHDWRCENHPAGPGTRPCTADQPGWRGCWTYTADDRGYLGRVPGPPRWFRTAVWQAPQRQGARRSLAIAREEYNTYGDTEVDVPSFQHRHNAAWYWY